MRTFLLIVFVTLTSHVCGQQTPSHTLKTEGPQSTSSILYSPDRQCYVAWFDAHSASPIGEVRPVIFRRVNDSEDLFSFVTIPGQATQAAWNSASTRCVIGDQPDNGSIFVRLVYKEKPDRWLWKKIDPLAPIYAAYLHAMGGKDIPLFRPYLDKVEWLTDTQVRFLIGCNLGGHEPKAVAGRYYVTIDFQTPDQAPAMKKIADE